MTDTRDQEHDDVTIEPEQDRDDGGSEEDLEAVESRVGAKHDRARKELEQCRNEKQEYLDGWQRAKADYVNALKRFDEEKRVAVKLGSLAAASAFLPALDSLARAKEAWEAPEGWSGIIKQLEDATASLGLSRVGEVGERFDPALHEALGQDSAEIKEEDDTITAVLEPGWKLGAEVIRPAKVRVAHFEG